MLVNPKTGAITLTEVGYIVLTRGMTVEQFTSLGLQLGVYSWGYSIEQKSLRILTAKFIDNKLKSVSMGDVMNNPSPNLQQFFASLLKTIGIEAKSYSWGEVRYDYDNYEGEWWLTITYK